MKFKIKSKKAQLFSLIAIALIGFMFVSYEVYSSVEKRHPIETRISSMESFLDSIEQNLERQIYISGFRTIFLAENRITTTGSYIDDTDSFFQEAFFNGTVNGAPDDILIGTTYWEIISSVNDKASKINVKISLNNSILTVEQVDPWNIKMTLTSDFIMEDKSELARWNKRQEIVAYIPIEGFEDPVFIINTNGKISHKVNKTIYEGEYTNGINNIGNLLSHVQNGYYSENSNAPNFLLRLEGNLSSDPNGEGIESFVSGSQLSNEGLVVQQKSKIDFIYFSSNTPISYSVAGMPSWFLIDDEGSPGHIEKYNVTGMTY